MPPGERGVCIECTIVSWLDYSEVIIKYILQALIHRKKPCVAYCLVRPPKWTLSHNSVFVELKEQAEVFGKGAFCPIHNIWFSHLILRVPSALCGNIHITLSFTNHVYEAPYCSPTLIPGYGRWRKPLILPLLGEAYRSREARTQWVN